MAYSGTVVADMLVMYTQYNNLRKDVNDSTGSHGHTGASEDGKQLSGAVVGGTIDFGSYVHSACSGSANICRVRSTSYNGDGTSSRTIACGFQPKYVLIVNTTDHDYIWHVGDSALCHYITVASGSITFDTNIILAATGFTVANGGTTAAYGNINEKVYTYTAYS